MKIHDLNFLHLEISTTECFKVLRCNGDNAIAHATLRIQLNLT
jgi:hypothetical protein